MPNQQVPNKRIWIIGAGASASHTGDFFPTLARVPKAAHETGALADLKDTLGFVPLRQFVERHFGKDLTRTKTINLEELLSVLDITLTITPNPGLQAARGSLIELIRTTIHRLHVSWAERRANSTGALDYDNMVASLGNNDSVITFNWDYLLDNAMSRVQRVTTGEADPGRRTPYDTFWQLMVEDRHGGYGGPRPSWPISELGHSSSHYLKVHGSIDWFECTNAECDNRGRLFPRRDYLRAPLCGFCLESLEGVLIPPTLDKKLRSSPWSRRLWTIASREIERATSIVIWGYSLPPTDFFSSWLFRQCNSEYLKEITIVDKGLVRHPRALSSKRGPTFNSELPERLQDTLMGRRSELTLTLFENAVDFFARVDVGTKYPAMRPAIEKLVKDLGSSTPSP